MGFLKDGERDAIFDTFTYTYENVQTIEEPPEGFIRVNQQYPQDSTIMAINAFDNQGQDTSQILELFNNGGMILRRDNRAMTITVNSVVDHTTWFEINFTVVSGSLYRKSGGGASVPETGDVWVLELTSFFDSFKFDTIGETDGTPWRSFITGGSGGIGQGNLDYIVVGINLKEEIEKRWGEPVDTTKYMYTVALGLKRTNSITGTKCHILGFSSLSTNPIAERSKDISSPLVESIFLAENGGLFCGSALYDVNGYFNQAGAIQSRKYFGTQNLSFGAGGQNYFWDFANEGFVPGSGNDRNANRGYLYSDLGNCSTINLANRGGAALPAQTLASDQTTYFWFSFNNQLRGNDAFPNRTQSTRAVFMGQGFSSPYFNIFKQAYPSYELYTNGSPQVGLIAPASTSLTQTSSQGVQPINSYYDGDQTFDEMTTFIFRVKLPSVSEQQRSVWFDDRVDIINNGDYFLPYKFLNNNYISGRPEFARPFGFKFYQFCKYASWENWLSDTPTYHTASKMWNDSFNIEWETDPSTGEPYDPVLQGVKGVGNYLFLARKEKGHCFNLDVCQTEPSYSILNDGNIISCSNNSNAADCISTVDPKEPGVLGWDQGEDLNAYCVRFPEDSLCGCTNTANNDNIVDFIKILEEETGIDLPNYCFSKACTDPSLNAWIDPRNDPDNCPSNLQFCITLIDIAGNNNVIQNTDIYQDCSNLVGDKDNGGGGGGGASSSTWVIIGIVLAVLIIGLVIFFIVRSRGK